MSSGGSRVRELVSGIPLVTKCLLGFNIGIYIFMFMDNVPLNSYSISAFFILNRHEYYRIVTSAFVHANAMHIFMNMTNQLQLGPMLERDFGSFIFFLISMWTVLFEGCLYVGIAW
jgi:rhomboid protease GluP